MEESYFMSINGVHINEPEAYSDFSITNKTWQRFFIFCFVANLLLYGGVIFQSRLYIDDIGRSMAGDLGYFSNGRPLAEIILTLLHLGSPLVNFSPLPQIIAVAILAVSGIVLARRYLIRTPFIAAIATLPLAGQPYYIENMSYTFDSPTMSLALCFALFGAIRLADMGKRGDIIVSSSCLLAALSCYQPAAGIFFVVYFFLTATRIDPIVHPLKYFIKAFLRLTVSSGLAFSLYAVVVWLTGHIQSSYTQEHSSVVKLGSIFPTIVTNTRSFFQTFIYDWSGNLLGYIFVLLFMISLLTNILMIFKKTGGYGYARTAGYIAVSSSIILLSPIAAFFPQMFLVSPVFFPRVYVGVGAVLCCSSLTICSYSASVTRPAISKHLRNLSILFLCVVVYCLSVFSYSYARANSEQKHYEDIIISGLVSDLQTVIAENKCTKLFIYGTIGQSPILKHAAKKFPLIGRLVPLHIQGDWYWGFRQLESAGITLADSPIATEKQSTIIKTNQPLIARGTYSIFVDGDTILLAFRPTF